MSTRKMIKMIYAVDYFAVSVNNKFYKTTIKYL